MRRVAVVAVAALVLTLIPTGAPAVAAPGQLVHFEGSGWGHGVGMSQYGSHAMATAGMTAEQILTYYYSGTTVKPAVQALDPESFMLTDPDPLWIGLAQNQTSLRFQVQNGQAGLCKAGDGEGECLPPLNGTQFAAPGENWEFRTLGSGACQFFNEGVAVGNPGTCRGSITWLDQPDTRVFFPDTGRTYARGTLKIRPNGPAAFHVLLEIGLEDYIYGIGEVPSSWPMEALKAQAIAARTYGARQALRWGPEAGFTAGRQGQCWCQLFSTVADQNYVGWSKESGLDGNRWVQAVASTAGQVVTHPAAPEQTIITAYYSSSSGGNTESNISGLGHTSPIPYLVSVADPWSQDPFNPFRAWTKDVTGADVADAYGLDSVSAITVASRHESGSAASVNITGLLNGSRSRSLDPVVSVKSTFGLRSSVFDVSVEVSFLPPFKDDDGSPYEEDIVTIYEAGITKGCAVDLYCPTDPVPRWQMALYLTRLHTASFYELPNGSSQGFKDLGGMSTEAILAINQLKQLAITKGTSATTYTPLQDVPRWQMALFITRLLAADGVPLPGRFRPGVHRHRESLGRGTDSRQPAQTTRNHRPDRSIPAGTQHDPRPDGFVHGPFAGGGGSDRRVLTACAGEEPRRSGELAGYLLESAGGQSVVVVVGSVVVVTAEGTTGCMLKPRPRKLASSARVMGSSGQYINGAELQPPVIPSS